VRALLRDAAVAEDDDAIAVADRGDAVRDQNGGAILQLAAS